MMNGGVITKKDAVTRVICKEYVLTCVLTTTKLYTQYTAQCLEKKVNCTTPSVLA